jgi:hypothetical protein
MNAEQIAAGLTKAQREVVINMRSLYYAKCFTGSPAALHALRRKGLSGGPFADTPTRLGLEVRAILMKEQTDAR